MMFARVFPVMLFTLVLASLASVSDGFMTMLAAMSLTSQHGAAKWQ